MSWDFLSVFFPFVHFLAGNNATLVEINLVEIDKRWTLLAPETHCLVMPGDGKNVHIQTCKSVCECPVCDGGVRC